MNTKMISLLLAVAMMLSLLTGCAAAPGEPDTTEYVPETTEAPQEELNLEELYNRGMEVLAGMGDSAPVLFPETDVNYLDNFYPGLASVGLEQLYAGVAPVTNAPFEIILVEVAEEADVQTVKEIFQARADRESGDSTYPENAEAWMNNCKITSRGCYVFLAVLMDPCQIPAEFILD